MVVLFVLDNLKLGGTQNLALRAMRGLADQGVPVELCVLMDSPDQWNWGWLPTRVHRLRCEGDYRVPGTIRRWSTQLASVVTEVRPALLHSWLWLSDVVSAGAAARCQLPHLAHLVDRREWQTSRRWRHRYRVWLTRRLFRQAGSRFLAVSRAAADYAISSLQLAPQHVQVAYNSIALEEFQNLEPAACWQNPAADLRLGIAARIEPEKGHGYLVEAVKILKDRGLRVSLQIVGEGSARQQLQSQIAAYDLVDRISYSGG
jgi:glycosyltransferase involved in cell wall biosynthesis